MVTARRRITVYLDQSHLSEALRGWDRLRAWIEEPPEEVRLVLSHAHVVETALRGWGQSPDRGVEMAAWLDGLATTWAKDFEVMEREEIDALIDRCAGRAPDAPDPFVASLSLTNTELTRRTIARVGSVSVVRRVSELRHGPDLAALAAAREELVRRGFEGAPSARARGLAPLSGSESRRQTLLGVRFAAIANSAWERRFGPALTDQRERIVNECANRMLEDAASAPAILTATTLANGQSYALGGRPALSKRAMDAHRGDMMDLHHAAVGASYADIFTADNRTADALSSLRLELGRSGPITSHGDELEFLAHLMETVGSARVRAGS